MRGGWGGATARTTERVEEPCEDEASVSEEVAAGEVPLAVTVNNLWSNDDIQVFRSSWMATGSPKITICMLLVSV